MDGFPHRDLDVYKRTIEAVSLIARISNAVPSRDGWLARQIRRSAGSILLNLGEGCGEHSPLEKARILRISRRSAFETGDGLQLVKLYSRPDVKLVDAADHELLRIASMLTKMSLRCEVEGIKKLATRKR